MSNKHDIIKLRRGTAAEWAASEPQPGGEVLKLGEPGYEKDTKKLKIGDGVTPWNSLPYIGGGDIIINPEDIQDIIGDGFLVSGSGINISYNDNLDSLTISTSGVSFVGHAHTISEVSGLQAILDSKQPSGVYASGIHSHSSSDITNFNSSVSGLLPVTNITAGSYISVSSSSGNFTLSATGLQPSGNYSISGHTHLSTDITDSTSFGRNILTAPSYTDINNLLWEVPATSGSPPNFRASSGGHYYIPPTLFAYIKFDDPVSGVYGDFYRVCSFDPEIIVNIGGVSYNNSGGIDIVRAYSNITSSWITVQFNNHNHTSSQITDFNTAVSGLLPVKNIIAGTGIDVINSSGIYTITSTFNSSVSGLLPTISNSGDNRLLTSTGTSTGINAESNITFDGNQLNVVGSISVDNLILNDNTISSSSGNIIISPSGNGALQRDGGGDPRGTYAVDWQLIRASGNMVASGDGSVIGGGSDNTSSSPRSTVGGGMNNTSSGWYSTVSGGKNNIASGQIGAQYGRSTVGGGSNNTASGNYSVVGGGAQNSASKTYSVVTGGKSNTASGQYSAINGGENNVATNWFSTVGGGKNNTASGYNDGGPYNYINGRATVGGGDTNSATANFSTIGGGTTNTASDVGSTIGGGGNNSATANFSTIGGGATNTASGSYSTVSGGVTNTASGNYSVVGGGGSFNVAAGAGSTVGGGFSNTSSGNYSTVGGGLLAVADRYGMRAYAAGSFDATSGSAQSVNFVLRRTTSDATPAILFLDGSSTRLTIPSGKALFATVTIAGIINGGSKAAHYVRKVAIKNVAGVTSLIGAVSTLGTDTEDDASYDVSITADNTNGALQINVTGQTVETIRWVAHVEGVEIAYG